MAKAVKSTKASPLTTESSHKKAKPGNAKSAPRPAAAELQLIHKDIEATLNAISRLETQEWSRAKREYEKVQQAEHQAHLKYTHTVECHYSQLKSQEDTLHSLEARRELQASSGDRKVVNVRKAAQERMHISEDIENYKRHSAQTNQLRAEQEKRLAAAKHASQQGLVENIARRKRREKREHAQTQQARAAEAATQCKATLTAAKAKHRQQMTELSHVQALLKK